MLIVIWPDASYIKYLDCLILVNQLSGRYLPVPLHGFSGGNNSQDCKSNVKVKSITFESLNTYGYENFKSFVEALWESINYLGNFMFYFPETSELARDFPISQKKYRIWNAFIPGKKVREK
jgi:hypothetical protein